MCIRDSSRTSLFDSRFQSLINHESNELRYELDINNKLPGDIETETQKWYAGLRFYGDDPEHALNADMCNFLAELQENRESLESYFTGKDMFNMWKKQTLEYLSLIHILFSSKMLSPGISTTYTGGIIIPINKDSINAVFFALSQITFL